MLITLVFGRLAGNFNMTERVSCGFARVFLWETKANAVKNISRASDETQSQFTKCVLDERFHLYTAQFEDYKPMILNRGKYQLNFIV